MKAASELKKHVLLYPTEQLLDSLSQLEPPFRPLVRELHTIEDPPLDAFMRETYIQRNSDQSFLLNEHTLADILDMNITNLLMQPPARLKYVQTYGYERKNGRLFVKNINLNRAILENSEFKRLLDYFPAAKVADLITNCTILIRYEGHYVQVTGPSLPERLTEKLGTIILHSDKRKAEGSWKRTDETLKRQDNGAPKPPPVDFYLYKRIERSRILFCNYTGRRAGIHRKNIFRLKPNVQSYTQQQTEATLNEMIDKTFANASDLLRHSERADLLKQYAQLLGNMRQFFSFFDRSEKSKWSEFSSLLYNTCTLPKNYRTLSLLAHSFHKNSAEQNAWTFNELYKNGVPYNKVSRVLVATLRRLLPRLLFGDSNTTVLLESVDEFVRMKRFEIIKVEDVVYRMDMFKVPWLCAHYNHKFHKQIMSRRRKAVAMVVLFLYNQLIVPLVQYNFYVTDYHKEGNKLFYYTKPIWTLIAHLAITMFSQNNLQPVSYMDNALNKYPQGKLRIMPKKDSFRPIITFNRKAGQDREKANLNQLLQDTQLVLRNLKEIVGVKFGFCVFDNRHISRKYDAFVRKWREQGRPELSFFTLDIKKCYDSICPSRLLEMIKDTPLIEDLYLIIKYQRMYRNKRPLSSQRSIEHSFNLRERECAMSLHDDLLKIIEDACPPAVHVFLPRQRNISRQEIIEKLAHICEQSYISFGRKRWRQTFGIPQGLNVSSVLCSLYFAYLESQYVTVKEGILMRLTDDYLYIGPKHEAEVVLRQLFICAEQSSFEFNDSKVKGNFESRFISKVCTERSFSWIGKTIHLDTLEMFPTVEYTSKRLEFAANVNIPRRSSYKYLKNKIKGLTTNHFYSYFKPHLFKQQSLFQTINIVCGLALQKFWPFIVKYAEDPTIKDKAKLVHKILSVTLHEFIIYACYLHSSEEHITTDLYYQLLRVAVGQYADFLTKKKSCRWLSGSSSSAAPLYRSLDVKFIYDRFMKRRTKLEQILSNPDPTSPLQNQP